MPRPKLESTSATPRTRVFCFHHKGGVGKSTTAAHLVAFELQRGRRVLLIDGDTERHAAEFFGVDKVALRAGRIELFDGQLTVVERDFGRLRQTAARKQTDAIIVDLSPNFVDFAATSTMLPPTSVLLPVKVDQGALRDLEDVMVSILRATRAAITVVSIGVPEAEIRGKAARVPPHRYRIVPVPFVPDIAERSFVERVPMWAYPDMACLRETYLGLSEAS